MSEKVWTNPVESSAKRCRAAGFDQILLRVVERNGVADAVRVPRMTTDAALSGDARGL